MPTKAGNLEDRFEANGGDKPQSLLFGQPWWRSLNNNGVSQTSASNESTRSPSGEPVNGSCLAGSFSGHINGIQDTGGRACREIQTSLAPQLESDNSQGQQPFKPVTSSMPQNLVDPSNSQMDLIGHSIVLTPYAFQDPTYGGTVAYAQAQQVNPHLFGLHQTRMPLPLPMEEEPVYVNAKQYHGILRRRQSRAKAELEKKVTKSRKPYLHESRHLHALRRARGAGGRFLNTKKHDENTDSDASKTDVNSTTNLQMRFPSSVHSEHISSTYTPNIGSWNQQEVRGKVISDPHKADPHASSGNNVHGLSSTYHPFSEERDNYGQGGMKLNGAVSVK